MQTSHEPVLRLTSLCQVIAMWPLNPHPKVRKTEPEEGILGAKFCWNCRHSTPNMIGRLGWQTKEMIEGSSVSYLTRTRCVPLFPTLFNRGGNRRVFRLPEKGRDHFHCAVEPSPGHIRCRDMFLLQNGLGGSQARYFLCRKSTTR